jgi:hypothetical protein
VAAGPQDPFYIPPPELPAQRALSEKSSSRIDIENQFYYRQGCVIQR